MKAESNIKVQTHKTNVLRWDEEHLNTLFLKSFAQFVSPPDDKRRNQLQGFPFHLFTSFRSSRFLLLLALSLLLLPSTEAVFGNFFRNLFNPVNDFFRPINNGFRNIFRFGSSSNAELRAAGDHFMLWFLTFLCLNLNNLIWFYLQNLCIAVDLYPEKDKLFDLIWFDLELANQTNPGKDKLFPDDCGRQDDGKGKLCFGDPELCRQSEHFIIYQWTHFSNGPISPRPPPCMPNRQYGPFLEIEIDICSPYYRVKLSAQRCHLIWTDAMMDVDNDEDDQSKTDNL